jgi:hypothetical protein
MEQFVILLLIALISIINWIVQKSKEAREKRKLEKRADATGEPIAKLEPNQPPPPSQTETAMRRLREALGLPDEAEPPVIPRRTEQGIPPPLPERPSPPALPRPARKPVVVHVPPVRRTVEHRVFDLPHRTFKSVAKAEAPRPPSRIRELLDSTGGLRDAIVLSEILGPPKSMREGEFPS